MYWLSEWNNDLFIIKVRIKGLDIKNVLIILNIFISNLLEQLLYCFVCWPGQQTLSAMTHLDQWLHDVLHENVNTCSTPKMAAIWLYCQSFKIHYCIYVTSQFTLKIGTVKLLYTCYAYFTNMYIMIILFTCHIMYSCTDLYRLL